MDREDCEWGRGVRGEEVGSGEKELIGVGAYALVGNHAEVGISVDAKDMTRCDDGGG